MSCEFLSAPGPRRVSRARRLSDALLSGELGDRLSVPLVSRTRRLSDALLQVVPNFPSSYHSPVSKLAKVLSRNKSQNNGQPVSRLQHHKDGNRSPKGSSRFGNVIQTISVGRIFSFEGLISTYLAFQRNHLPISNFLSFKM